VGLSPYNYVANSPTKLKALKALNRSKTIFSVEASDGSINTVEAGRLQSISNEVLGSIEEDEILDTEDSGFSLSTGHDQQ